MLLTLFAYLSAGFIFFDFCGNRYENVTYVCFLDTGSIVWSFKSNASDQYSMINPMISDDAACANTSNDITSPNEPVEPMMLTYSHPKSDIPYIAPITAILSFIIGVIINPDKIIEKLKAVVHNTRYRAAENVQIP